MSPAEEPLTPFERSARAVLEESVLRIDGRTRVAPEPGAARSARGRREAAASLVAQPFHDARGWGGRRRCAGRRHAVAPAPGGELAEVDGQHAVEDLDLLADGEALDLVEQGDGSFYEWAAAQNEANGESDG